MATGFGPLGDNDFSPQINRMGGIAQGLHLTDQRHLGRLDRGHELCRIAKRQKDRRRIAGEHLL